MPDLAPATLPLPDWIPEAIDDIRNQGVPARAAFVSRGLPNATYYAWLNAAATGTWPNGETVHPGSRQALVELRHEIERAEAEAESTAGKTLWTAGKSPAGTLEWRAHFEHLKHNEATRARWREHRELRITQEGSVSHEHRIVRGLTDSDLAAALPVEWRELLPEATVVSNSEPNPVPPLPPATEV